MSQFVLLRALCAAAVLTIGTFGVAAAEDATPTPSASPLPEIGHVQTSDRSTETLQNVTRTIYVVTKGDIIRKGYRSIADAVESVPGLNLSAYGPTGALASVGIRGSSSAQVLVLIDGIPAGGAQTGSIDLNSISTAGVDRVEVVEGGGSTLYGAGSIGGIINIITKPLDGSAIVEVRDGSYGDRMARVQTKNFSFERAVAANNYAFPGGTRTGADSEMTDARFVFDGRFGSLGASFSGGINAHNAGVPGSVPATFTTPSRQRSVDRNLYVELTAKHGNALTSLELGVTSQQLLFNCDNPADFNCFTPLATLSQESRIQASIRNTVTHPNSKTIYGIDLARGVARIDDGGATNLFNPPPDEPIVLTNAFSQAALYAQQSWITRSGSRYYFGIRGERDGSQGGIIAPSLGFLQHLSNDIVVRANYATAFRAPTAPELYYPFYGSTTIQPERVRVADLKVSDAALLGGASLSWFGSWAHNLIVSDPATFMAANIGVASIAGLTGEIRTKPYHHVYDRLSVTDLYRALNLTAGSANYNGRIFGAGPVFQVTNELGFIGDQGAFIESAGISARNHGAQTAFGTAAAYTRIDGFVRLRLNDRALLTLRTYNLGNEIYQEQAGYPMPGRSFVLELSTR